MTATITWRWSTDLEETFVVAVQQDLRTRLLMNPLGTLSMLLSHDGLGRRMGRIYQRYIYSGAVDALRKQDSKLPRGGRLNQWLWPISNWLWPGWIALRSLHFRPGGHETVGGLDGYNQGVLSATEPGCAIPNFIMNSTALNSAAPFRFSSVEIGDPRLGYFRYDEADLLAERKDLLETPPADLRAMLNGTAALPQVKGTVSSARSVVALALWWLSYNTATPEMPSQFGEWTEVFGNPSSANAADVATVVCSMCKTNFGRLRQLKLPAWYLRLGPSHRAVGGVSGVTGGALPAQHRARFNQVLGEVEPTVSAQVTAAITGQSPLGDQLLDFAIQLYYLRSAQVMSPRLRADVESISLATAVAASANFPPVFPPLVLLGIYDDLHVTRLGLSDGGVYDNMGITTLLDEGCTHIIASDTGAPFDVTQRVSSRYTGMVSRLPAVLTDDVAEQQRTQLRERRHVSARLAACQGGSPALRDLKDQYGLKSLAFFSIDSVNPAGCGGGIPLDFAPEAVARLRTDLDSFGDMEVAALINTGYDRADRFLRAYFTEPLYSAQSQSDWNSPAVIPRPINAASAQRMSRVLTVGQSRLFRSLRLGSWLSWLFTLAAILAVLYSIGFQRLSLESLISTTIPRLILKRLETPVPRFPDWCINRVAQWLVKTPAPLWLMLLALAALALVVFKGWPLIVDRFRSSRTANERKVMTAVKWARAFAPALVLFVGLAPVWVAGATFVIASISYLAFNKPFLRETRMQ